MEIKKNGLTLKVDKDISYNHNPREDYNLGIMFCFHRRYRLGDKGTMDDPEKFNDWLQANKKEIYCKLPVYMYEHTGICLSTHDFNDHWDSGKIGYIVCTNERLEELGFDNFPKEEIEKMLEQEVDEYSAYLENRNDYYYYSISDNEQNVLESCSGYKFEDLKDMLNEMKDEVEEKYSYLFKALYKKQENCL